MDFQSCVSNPCTFSAGLFSLRVALVISISCFIYFVFFYLNSVNVKYQRVTGSTFIIKNKKAFCENIKGAANCGNLTEFNSIDTIDNLYLMKYKQFLITGEFIECEEEGIPLIKIDKIMSINTFYFRFILISISLVILLYVIYKVPKHKGEKI